MKWRFLAYEQDTSGGIKPHFCHPLVAKHRIEHIKEKYDHLPIRDERVSEMWVDFGGMIIGTDPKFYAHLGPDRTLGCWCHQVSDVLLTLKNASSLVVDGKTYFKFGSWPGRLHFISRLDKEKAITALTVQLDLDKEGERHELMRSTLEEGQGLPKGALSPQPIAKA